MADSMEASKAQSAVVKQKLDAMKRMLNNWGLIPEYVDNSENHGSGKPLINQGNSPWDLTKLNKASNTNTNTNSNTNSNTNTNTNTNTNSNTHKQESYCKTGSLAGSGCGGVGVSVRNNDFSLRNDLMKESGQGATRSIPDPYGLRESVDPAYGKKTVSRCGVGVSEEKERISSLVDDLVVEMEVQLGIRGGASMRAELESFANFLGLELCRYAVDQAQRAGKYHWEYVRGILRNLVSRGIRDLREAEAYDRTIRRRMPTQGSYSAYGSQRNSIFQTHGKTTLTPLERYAVESALREEFD